MSGQYSSPPEEVLPISSVRADNGDELGEPEERAETVPELEDVTSAPPLSPFSIPSDCSAIHESDGTPEDSSSFRQAASFHQSFQGSSATAASSSLAAAPKRARSPQRDTRQKKRRQLDSEVGIEESTWQDEGSEKRKALRRIPVIPEEVDENELAHNWDLAKHLLKPTFQLKPHQKRGVYFLACCNQNAEQGYSIQAKMLADEMGLGKTPQALAALCIYLAKRRQDRSGNIPPVLIIVPLALVDTWEQAIRKFTKLKHGIVTSSKQDKLALHRDVIITSYSRLRTENNSGKSMKFREKNGPILLEVRISAVSFFHLCSACHLLTFHQCTTLCIALPTANQRFPATINRICSCA